MKFLSILIIITALCSPAIVSAQDGNFETCYVNRCADSELTLLELGNVDEIAVKSTVDGSTYEIISFTVTYQIGRNEIECTCRGNKLTARCMALKDKLAIDGTMEIKDVVFKDIKGGGKIRTAPALKLTIVKPEIEE